MATSRGMDVSAYQSAQDWQALKAKGVVFAFAKASEGQHSRDDRFDTHMAGIIKAGLVPGGYHFAWPTQSVTAEAANYIAAVRPYARPGMVHWLDLERYSDGRNYGSRSAKQIKAWVAEWLRLVAAAYPGQRVGVYTSASDVAAGHLPAGTTLWFPRYPWGEADWPRAEATAQPTVSGVKPLFWQFTSRPYDRNIAYLSEAALRAWAQGDTTTEEDDMALSADDITKIADELEKRLFHTDGVYDAPADAADYDPKEGSPGHGWTGQTVYRDLVTRTRGTNKAVTALTAQVGAISATVGELAKGGGLTAAEIQAAAEAGAQAALAKLGDRLQED
ncbi:glycoside hydrolase family 25 protein [Streptomyces sp. NPDC048278]|uniref:glycoside hydrolase family 25 protein n=1 Tax=Streptomyces sp. NPDC048278 TaxID=3155809 RepID=UPI003422204D